MKLNLSVGFFRLTFILCGVVLSFSSLLSATTVTLTTSNASVTFGTSVTFTAQVTPSTATGTVTFKDGNTTLGAGTVSSGRATYTISALAAGSHTITGSYSGNNWAATSNSIVETVSKAILTIQANNLTMVCGGSVPTLSYTSSGYMNGNTSAVLSGTPALSTTANSASAVGSYPITVTAGTLSAANYSFNFVGGTMTVGQATPTIVLSSSYSSVSYGTSVTFSAQVTPSAATGTVTFEDGGTTLASVPVSGQIATYTSSALTSGSHTVTATYSGNGNYAPAASNSLTESVTKAGLTIQAVNLSMTYGSPVPSLTYTSSGYMNGDTASALTGAPALSTTATSTSAVGSYLITVAGGTLSATNYSFNFINGTLNIKATPAVGLVATPSHISVGSLATFTATIIGGSNPTGTVSFQVNGTSFGTASVVGGIAVYNGSNESWVAGSYTIAAVYSGDSNNTGATGTATETVSGTADTGTITLTVNGVLAASTNYGGSSTPSTIAAGLATGVTPNSPVNITALEDSLYLVAKQTGSATNYAYSLQTTSYDSMDYSYPSFLSVPVSGNLQGGASQSSSGNTPVYSYSIPPGGYDADNNLLNVSDSVMGTWSFSYDSLNRLAGATNSQQGNPNPYYCWGYDAFGNRTMQAGSSLAFQSASPTCQAASNASTSLVWANYNGNNQFTNTIQAANGVQYDAAGNVANDGVNQYLYDAEGSICAVSTRILTGVGTMTGYIYSADGQRVSKGSITAMSCDPTVSQFTPTNDYVLGLTGEQFTEMAMGSGGVMVWKHTNVFAAGQLLATYDPDGLHYYLTDSVGTRRAQTDYAGVLEQTCSSLPFGDGVNCTGSIQSPTEHHFTGKERDTETGLDYFGTRYYGSNMGRFTSPDGFWKDAHAADPQSWNEYAYVRNNPVHFVDPTGGRATVFGKCDSWRSDCSGMPSLNGLAFSAGTIGVTKDNTAQQNNAEGPLVVRPTYEQIDLRAIVRKVLGFFGIRFASATTADTTDTPKELPLPANLLWIDQIVNGHGWEDHGRDEFNSKEEYKHMVLGTVQEATGNDVKHPSKGRTLFWNDKEGFAVWRDKNHPDQGTAYHPSDVDRFKKTWGLE